MIGSGSIALAVALLPRPKSVDLDDPNSVSPGILGFLAFFLLAVALYFLVRNMNGHLRRVRYRQEALDKEEALQKEKDGAITPAADRAADPPVDPAADSAKGPSTPTP